MMNWLSTEQSKMTTTAIQVCSAEVSRWTEPETSTGALCRGTIPRFVQADDGAGRGAVDASGRVGGALSGAICQHFQLHFRVDSRQALGRLRFPSTLSTLPTKIQTDK